MGCLYSILIYFGLGIFNGLLLGAAVILKLDAVVIICVILSICTIPISLLIGFSISKSQEKRRQSAAEEKERTDNLEREKQRLRQAEESRLQSAREEQQRYHAQLTSLCESSITQYEMLPNLLSSAEK